MSSLSTFELETPSSTCLCGCRGDASLHEAFEAGLEGEAWRQRRLPRPPSGGIGGVPPRPPARRPGLRPPPGHRPAGGPRPGPKPPRRHGYGPYWPGIVGIGAYPYAVASGPEAGTEHVRWVQDCLNQALGLNLPVTGVMGPETRSAVRSFQRRQGLRMDGIIGPPTEAALAAVCGGAGAYPGPQAAPAGPGPAGSGMAPGDSGPQEEWEGEASRGSPGYIRWVQSSLNRILGLKLAVDGISGSMTRSAIRSFQQKKGLSVDGIVGPITEAALISAGAGSPPAAGEPSSPTLPGGGPDIVTVRGIQVARQIASQVEDLLAAAAADGLRLGGGGYRSPQEQIDLRIKHCCKPGLCTSHYDIYEKSSKECSPWTAPPGYSNHEKGLAIDFTYNGASIESQSNPGFQWLARNASRFGLINLPSEPWHWSVDGR